MERGGEKKKEGVPLIPAKGYHNFLGTSRGEGSATLQTGGEKKEKRREGGMKKEEGKEGSLSPIL